MAGVVFDKYEGLGNDFLVVDAQASDAQAITPARVKALCDRRFGVGGDGVLLVLPPTTAGARARMRVLNADGSVPEMCGNGLRCVAVHLARLGGAGSFVVDTDAGPKTCLVEVTSGGAGEAGHAQVTVDMGRVEVTESISLEVAGETWPFRLASAGNPHAITVRPAARATIEKVGPLVERHARFPAGTNVEFAVYRGREIDLVVWERGVGITHACGTGACATVAVGVADGLCPMDEEVVVHLPGGDLGVRVTREGHAIMRGPARRVYSGRYEGGP